MSGIWTKTEAGWRAALSRKFDNEAELHDLVEGNIQMLPLAGSPRLFVLGREVPLGRGYADLLALEEQALPQETSCWPWHRWKDGRRRGKRSTDEAGIRRCGSLCGWKDAEEIRA